MPYKKHLGVKFCTEVWTLLKKRRQRRNEIQAQEKRLEQLIEKQRQDHVQMQDQAQQEYVRRKNEIETLEISSDRGKRPKNHYFKTATLVDE